MRFSLSSRECRAHCQAGKGTIMSVFEKRTAALACVAHWTEKRTDVGKRVSQEQQVTSRDTTQAWKEGESWRIKEKLLPRRLVSSKKRCQH